MNQSVVIGIEFLRVKCSCLAKIMKRCVVLLSHIAAKCFYQNEFLAEPELLGRTVLLITADVLM